MKLYQFTFKPLSSITKIPDAQTIFGAICAIIRFTKGEDELQRYLDSFDDQPLFVHSSMFGEGLLPMAKVGLISITDKNKNIFSLPPHKQLQYATDLKKYKGLKYISLDVFKDYVLDGQFDDLRKAIDEDKITATEEIVSSKETLILKSQLLVHNSKPIIEDSIKDDRKLFYEENVYLSSNVCIYVKTDDIDYVKSIFQYFPYLGIGNRVSVGKNCYEMIDVKEIEPFVHQTDYRMLLSKCISDEFDLDESNYMIDSSTYRGSKYYSSNMIGRINKFVEGSYMKVKQDQEYYGKVIRVSNDKQIYHYGIGFVL
ncbi:MAG: hypothetical protein J6P61_02570 [Erysipelotrichaceae bacterium]|nr:hypothetical protein [Erysipelotrichaceae bacterium]